MPAHRRPGRTRLVGPRDRLPLPATFALTFDDGPDEHFTPLVLDLLAARGAPATFFLVGRRAAQHPALVRRIVSDGHAVGSHTWSHPELEALPAARLLAECASGRAVVQRIAGRSVRAYRPPKGHWDSRGAVAARALALEPWMWSLDPADWAPHVTAEQLLARLDGLGSQDVVLLHDGLEAPTSPAALDRSATLAVLPALLDLGHARGLRPVALPRSSPRSSAPHHVPRRAG